RIGVADETVPFVGGDVVEMRIERRLEHAAKVSVEFFRLQTDVLLAGGFLFPVFLDPGFKALAGGGVFSRELEPRDLIVLDRNFFRGIFWKQPHATFAKRLSVAGAVENIP